MATKPVNSLSHIAHAMPGQERIAIFMRSLDAGGGERIGITLARAFSERGHAIDLVVTDASGPYRAHIPTGVQLIELAPSSSIRACLQVVRREWHALAATLPPLALPTPRLKRLLPYLPALGKYLKNTPPDSLLVINTYSNILAMWAQRYAGSTIPIVLSEHNAFGERLKLKHSWRRHRLLQPLVHHTYQRAHSVVAVSQAIADELVQHARLPSRLVHTIYNPIYDEYLFDKACQLPSPHAWLDDGQDIPVILGAGRLVSQKGFMTLLHAFAHIAEQRKVRLIILGEGEQRAEIEQEARRLQIEDSVFLPGWVQNPYAFMSRAKLFVLSSTHEGLPNVLIEAMACGCPVVSTDCPHGPYEILAGGQYGPLVPVGDIEALAHSMHKQLDMPPSADEMRSRASEFGVDRSAQQYLQHLHDSYD